MDRPGHENATYFVGREVERTPMFGQRTLFVVGVRPAQEILGAALTEKCPHIFLGANHSFEPTNQWRDLLIELLEQDILVTLDFDQSHWLWVLESGAPKYNNFFPIVSVKLPYIQQAGYNAVIKLDDSDFEHSNPGVWCHEIRELQGRDKFTPWRHYKNDQVLGDNND